jgi:cytochrome P450
VSDIPLLDQDRLHGCSKWIEYIQADGPSDFVPLLSRFFILTAMSSNHILTPALLASVAAVAIFAYAAGLVTYRLYFHPLAKYPGNLIDKITGWHDFYYTFTGNRHLVHQALHEKYGDFVRINPNTLSVNTATGLKDIYGFKANARKSDWYMGLLSHPGAYSTHSVISKPEHSTKRRIMAHAFSENALRAMEPQMSDIVNEWITKLGEKCTPTWDMSVWTNFLSLDILSKLCFGESTNTISSTTNRWAIDALMTTVILRYPHGFKPIFFNSRILRRLVYGAIPPMDQSPFVVYARTAVTKRMSPEFKSTDKDFISYLIEAKDPNTGEGFTLPQVWAESSLLIAAGSDTSSTAMSALLFYLTRHPDKLSKLITELKSHFPTVDDIHSGPELTACVYLRACIDEALRIAPPVPALLPRTSMPGGITIDGHVMPEGVNIGVGAYSLHHNPSYFPEPYAFKPERWIVDSDSSITDESVRVAKEAFCPFSVGPRGCIGKNMAYLELMLVVGRLLFVYDVKKMGSLGEGGKERLRERKDEFQLFDRFICYKEGPEVGFTPRSAVAA